MNNNEIIIPCRLSYAHLWEPHVIKGSDSKPKYSVMCLIPKTDTKTIKRLTNLVEEVKQNSAEKWGGRIPAKLKSYPLHDGDEEVNDDGEPMSPGNIYLNAADENQPQVIDRRMNPIIDQGEVYSGCYANVKLSIYAYNHPTGGKGLSAGLVAVQKTKDGERLGSGNSGLSGFDVLDDDDEDMLN